jgi:hypothetical protein
VGAHIITASATDSGGLSGQHQISITVNAPNTPPTVSITAPADGATFNEGHSITFTGTATDAQDGDLTSSLTWTSSLDGPIGSGASFTRSDLSVGAHIITASATDSGGLSGQHQISLTVNALNTPPTVSITAPADGATYTAGQSITFSGTATDAQDGDLSASLTWTSDLDGPIGTGDTFSRSDLSAGAHIITASTIDSGGLSGSDQISITVNAATISVTLSDDAEVDSKAPTANFGSSSVLELRAQNNQIINSYLKFVITGSNGSVQSAKLRLYVNKTSSSDTSIYAVSNNYPNTTTPWTEAGLTWANAPSFAGGTYLSTVGAVTAGTWVEFDVTATIPGDGTYSFGLSGTSANRASYNSKEAVVNQPVLVIQLQTGP